VIVRVLVRAIIPVSVLIANWFVEKRGLCFEIALSIKEKFSAEN